VIGRRSVILDEADRWLFPVIMLVSVYVTFRGHNAPGGGFAGGLIAGGGFVLRFLAGGSPRTRRSSLARPTSLIGIGLFIAVVTALAPIAMGDAMLESTIWKPHVPLVGTVKVVSSSIFDVGVYVLVVGVVLAVIVALGADPIHEQLRDDDHDRLDAANRQDRTS
jgi:multisubunit Na+/H+ antiporter MnhB subunit